MNMSISKKSLEYFDRIESMSPREKGRALCRVLLLWAVVCAGIFVASCTKSVDTTPDALGGRIGFAAQGVSIQAMTKAEVLTSMSSFYVTATTGSAGSESQAFGNEQFAKVGDDFVGQVYWPVSNPGYHFYASNVPMEFRPAGTVLWADSQTDVVYAYLGSPSFRRKNTLTFKHAFALLDAVVVNAAPGYSISGVSVSFTPKAGGTFNLSSGYGRTDGTGWSEVVDGQSVRVASATGSNANTVFTVPGEYLLSASWTASLNGTDYQGDTFKDMATPVTLVGGKRNVLTVTLGGNPQEIRFTVTVLPWDDYDMGEQQFPIE